MWNVLDTDIYEIKSDDDKSNRTRSCALAQGARWGGDREEKTLLPPHAWDAEAAAPSHGFCRGGRGKESDSQKKALAAENVMPVPFCKLLKHFISHVA